MFSFGLYKLKETFTISKLDRWVNSKMPKVIERHFLLQKYSLGEKIMIFRVRKGYIFDLKVGLVVNESLIMQAFSFITFILILISDR